jgi:hypothetical protein
MTIFSNATRDLLGDAAEAALKDSRDIKMPDWQSRESFITAAAIAFDVAAEPPAADAAGDAQDAQP